MTKREQLLTEAYRRGFEKGAQEASAEPTWLSGFSERLQNRENAGRTGYDPITNVWRTYPDINRGGPRRPAIGPGIVVPEGTTMTDQALRARKRQEVLANWRKTQRLYPGVENETPHAQQLMTDITYSGAGKYPKLWDAIQRRDAQRAAKEYHISVTPPGQPTRPNTRRNELNYNEYVSPMTNSWGRAVAPAPAAATTDFQKATRDAAIGGHQSYLKELLNAKRLHDIER